jgi:hypothetical protein
MRIPATLIAFALLCAPLAPMAAGQNAPASPAMPACDGLINVVRLSEITPTGSIDKFMAAVAAHQAWYASHRYPDVIVAARILERDPQTHAESYSDKQVLTFHYIKPDNTAPLKHDAEWDAYIKMYNETSTIKETYVVCVPMAAAPASMK